MTFTGGTPHKTHVIVATSALIILAVILGFFAYQQNPQLFSWLTQPSQNEATDTSTWQTYRNEEYGFEFRYPTSWNVENSDVGPGATVFSANCRIHIGLIDQSYFDHRSALYEKCLDGPTGSSCINSGDEIHFFKSNSGGIASFYLDVSSDRSTCLNSNDQILATFKFTR